MKNILSSILLSAAIPAASLAETITFPNFNSSAGLQLNGTAAVATNVSNQHVLRLTTPAPDESGTAFSTSSIPLSGNTSFSTAFSFQMTDGGGIQDPDPNGPPGADGIVFAVQNVTNTFGGIGVGLGFAGLSPSLGIEFDTWDDSAAAGFPGVNDPNGNHVGIDVNGNVDSVQTANNLPGFLNNGKVWYSWIDYNGATDDLQVRLSSVNARPADPILDQAFDLNTDLGVPRSSRASPRPPAAHSRTTTSSHGSSTRASSRSAPSRRCRPCRSPPPMGSPESA